MTLLFFGYKHLMLLKKQLFCTKKTNFWKVFDCAVVTVYASFFRSSCSQMFFGVLKIFAKATENTCVRVSALIKLLCILKYSSLPNRCVARNMHGGGKDELFFISAAPGISMVVRIFRSVSVMKRRTK